jgi:hypothetical protein
MRNIATENRYINLRKEIMLSIKDKYYSSKEKIKK